MLKWVGLLAVRVTQKLWPSMPYPVLANIHQEVGIPKTLDEIGIPASAIVH